APLAGRERVAVRPGPCAAGACPHGRGVAPRSAAATGRRRSCQSAQSPAGLVPRAGRGAVPRPATGQGHRAVEPRAGYRPELRAGRRLPRACARAQAAPETVLSAAPASCGSLLAGDAPETGFGIGDMAKQEPRRERTSYGGASVAAGASSAVTVDMMRVGRATSAAPIGGAASTLRR